MTAVLFDSNRLALKTSQLLEVIISNPELYAHLNVHHLQFSAIIFDAKIEELDKIDLQWILDRNEHSHLSTFQENYLSALKNFYNQDTPIGEHFELFYILGSAYKKYDNDVDVNTDLIPELSNRYLKQYCILLCIDYKKNDTVYDIIERFYLKKEQRSHFQMQLFASIFKLFHNVNIKTNIDFRVNILKLLDTTAFNTDHEQLAASKLHYMLTWKNHSSDQTGIKKLLALVTLFIQYWTTFSYKNKTKVETQTHIPPERLKNAAETAKRLSTTYKEEKDYLKTIKYDPGNKSTVYNRLLLLEAQYAQIVKLADDLLKQQIEKKIYLAKAELYLLDRITNHSNLDEQISDAEQHFDRIYRKSHILS